MVMQFQRELPAAKESKRHLVDNTKELWRSKPFRLPGNATDYEVRISAEWFDKCKNGSNTFYYHEAVVLAGTDKESNRVSTADDIPSAILRKAAMAGELRKLAKWSGCHPFGPWYYIENTVFLAGDRDCNGLRKGERRQIRSGKTGELAWHLAAVSKKDGSELPLYKLDKYGKDGPTAPECEYTLEYRPWCHVGEGQERNLQAARNVAIWPDATDEELCSDTLAVALQARLPALVDDFRRTIESLGFEW